MKHIHITEIRGCLVAILNAMEHIQGILKEYDGYQDALSPDAPSPEAFTRNADGSIKPMTPEQLAEHTRRAPMENTDVPDSINQDMSQDMSQDTDQSDPAQPDLPLPAPEPEPEPEYTPDFQSILSIETNIDGEPVCLEPGVELIYKNTGKPATIIDVQADPTTHEARVMLISPKGTEFHTSIPMIETRWKLKPTKTKPTEPKQPEPKPTKPKQETLPLPRVASKGKGVSAKLTHTDIAKLKKLTEHSWECHFKQPTKFNQKLMMFIRRDPSTGVFSSDAGIASRNRTIVIRQTWEWLNKRKRNIK